MGRKLRWLLISIAGGLFALTLVGVYDVRFYYFDEPIYIDAAQALADGEEVENWEHPPLGKYLILAGRTFSSDKVAGSRLPSMVALLVILAFLGLVAERLYKDGAAPGLAGAAVILLALTDPFLVNLSKVAMLEVFVVAFTVVGLYFVLRYRQEGGQSNIYCLGVAAGLAIATKWSAVPVFTVFFAFVIRRDLKATVFALVLGVSIYITSFLPYLWIRERGLGWMDIVHLHKSMLDFHRGFNFVYPHQSEWWTWPVQWRPVWLLTQTGENKLQGLLLLGNLVTYIVGPIGLVALALRRRGWPSLLLLMGYLSTLAFWSLAGRRTYFYYYLMCAPFIYLGALAVFGELLRRRAYLGYLSLVMVIGVFALYYPVVRFIEVPDAYVKAAFFLPSWLYLFN